MAMKRDGRPQAGDEGSQAWYVAEGERGERLLDQGQVAQAVETFEAILTRLGDAPSYGRAVILGRLGRCFHVDRRPDFAVRHVREALDVLGQLAPSDGVKALRGALRSELGDALRADGRYSDARKAYEAALKIAEELSDVRGQGVDLGNLGALAMMEGKFDEALTRQREALRRFQQIHEPEMQAAAWHQLGRVYHQLRQTDQAVRHYEEAARINTECGRLAAAAQTWNQLAVLAQEAGQPETAEAWCRKALAVAQSLDPAAPASWKHYGVLADIVDQEARTTADDEERAALSLQSRHYRELEQRAPIISATLAQVGESPTFARAVLHGQLARCFHMGGRPDLAVACAREAIGIAAMLPSSHGLNSLLGVLFSDLGDMLRAAGHDVDARSAHEAALKIAEESQDLRGQEHALRRLGRTFQEPRQRNDDSAFQLTLEDEVTIDYVFDTDLLVDGPRERRTTQWTEEPTDLLDDARPVLLPRARTWMDDHGAVRLGLPPGEPIVERQPGCMVMRRIRREVAVSGRLDVLWRLISALDGSRRVAEILSALPASDHVEAARMLATLTATGVIDVSGRPMGRFLHMATKKGVLPAGGLEGDAVLRLATDGGYRTYPDAPRIAVSDAVPDRLHSFHALTRSRRSHRNYGGLALSRGDFDALLHTACGVTGTMSWEGREVKLRAYPSSGALYAVEIYPVVSRVEGLESAVYHYRASENVLEVVKPVVDWAGFVAAALPVERAMVEGAAALVCLAGWFPRHERKYGEGGYRMLVAEAGHMSQNLILAAIALGLSARPFGGVFDDLLNRALGLDTEEEQFLLAVLIGHAEIKNSEFGIRNSSWNS